MEKTSEETRSYAPSISSEERVRLVPELKRLSVALFLDESVQDARLEDAVKAAVGFNDSRSDTFTSVTLPFVVPEAPAEEAGAAVAVPAATNPLVETLLRRGLEIVIACAFIVVLMRTLRGSRKDTAVLTPARDADRDGVDSELLARAQVDELLRSDPARVGEILSRWAREEPVSTR